MKVQRYEVETLAEAIGAEKAAMFEEGPMRLMRARIDGKLILAWRHKGVWNVGQD